MKILLDNKKLIIADDHYGNDSLRKEFEHLQFCQERYISPPSVIANLYPAYEFVD